MGGSHTIHFLTLTRVGMLVALLLPCFLLLCFEDKASVVHLLEEDETLIVQIYNFDSSFIHFAHFLSNKDVIKGFDCQNQDKGRGV